MANAGTVNINLVAQTAAFISGLNKASGELKLFGSTVDAVKGLVAGFLGYEAIRKTAEWVSSTMEAVDAQAKLADRLGVSTEALSGLTFAGDLAGVSSESLGAALTKMELKLSGAATGAQATTDALREMGLSTGDLLSLAPDQQFLKIADGLQKLGTSGDRARVAVELFGKAGAELLPLLNEGAAGIAADAKEAEALGIAFSRVDAAKVEAANDALTRVGATLKGGLNAVAIALAPAIEEIANQLVRAAKDAGGFGAIATDVFGRVAHWVGVLGDAWNVVRAGVAAVQVAFGIFGEGVLWVGEKIARAVIGWGQLFGQFGDFAGAVATQWGLLWGQVTGSIRNAVETMVAKMSGVLANFLATTANALPGFMAATAGTLNAASLSISTTMGTLEADSARSLARTVAAAEKGSKDVEKAWANFGNVSTDNNPIVQQFIKGQENAHEYATEAAFRYKTAFEKVLDQSNSTIVNTWFAQVASASQASATEHARVIEKRMAEDRDAAAFEMEIDSSIARSYVETLDAQQLKEAETYQRRLEELKKFHDQALLSDAEFQALQAQAESKHQVHVTQLGKSEGQKQLDWDKRTGSQKLDFAAGVFGALTVLMNSHSRKQFEIGKAAAIAQAVISTAAGVVRQFAELPIYLAIPAAAVVAAAGIAQISSIASTSFEGGGSVASAAGASSPVDSGTGGRNGQPTQAGVTGAGQQAQRVDVSGIEDDGIYSGKFLRKFVDLINGAQRDGSPIQALGVV